MTYDFTTILDRSGKDAVAANNIPFQNVKVEEGFTSIPMWVADMSFVLAPPVISALEKRLHFHSMGYFDLSDEYYDSIISWQKRRNGVDIGNRDYIGYENSVLGGVSTAVQCFTGAAEKILVHAPTYVGFTKTLDKLGRPLVHSPLKMDENGIWRMDFEDMDRKIKENNIHLAIFCSPHNPSGRVWERWEIEKAMEVYAANDCLVISDEIWSDLVMPGYKHIPTQSVSEDAKNRTIALYAPSKTFSLAGLVGSYHIIYNNMLRNRMRHLAAMSHYNQPNVLSMHALIGAFSADGEVWANEVCQVIDKNMELMTEYLKTVPDISFMRAQGTYMLYLDCSKWCEKYNVTLRELQHRGVRKGVIWQDGEPFKMDGTIRINLSLPTSQVEEVIRRLKKYVFL